ncbi:hypothetical protein [Rubrivirga sp.]|uniref:hypothetical protein n=1 Tax=Rubrivirga sp. TaxID=1885344 RepID=UPI003C735BC8
MPDSSHPLSPAQRRVLDGALEVVRDQRRRVDLEVDDFNPVHIWATPFGLGYTVGVVDALCQVHGAPFDGMALAVWALVLEDTFGRVQGDRLRQRGLDLLEAKDPDFNRGRPWGGNEAMGAAQGQHTPVGLVHLARGDEHRMGGAG